MPHLLFFLEQQCPIFFLCWRLCILYSFQKSKKPLFTMDRTYRFIQGYLLFSRLSHHSARTSIGFLSALKHHHPPLDTCDTALFCSSVKKWGHPFSANMQMIVLLKRCRKARKQITSNHKKEQYNEYIQTNFSDRKYTSCIRRRNRSCSLMPVRVDKSSCTLVSVE